MGDHEDQLWMSQLDPKTGKEYSYNVATGKTSWKVPVTVWHQARDVQSNRLYYFNLGLQQTTWARPVDYDSDNDIDEDDESNNSNNNNNNNNNKSNNSSESSNRNIDKSSSTSNKNLNKNNDDNDDDNNNNNTNINPGIRFEYEYGGGDGVSNGKWLPAVCGESGRQYWYNSEQPKPYWTKPKGAKHAHKEHHPVKIEKILNDAARTLSYAVNDAKQSNMELQNVAEQLQKTADQRFAQVTAMSRAQKLKSVNSQITHGRTGRHMENQLHSTVPTSSSKVRPDRAIASFLKSVPLFHKLEEKQFGLVQRNLNRVTFRDGDVIVKQDTPGVSFYLIEHGQVRVYVQDIHAASTDSQAIFDAGRESVLGSSRKIGSASTNGTGANNNTNARSVGSIINGSQRKLGSNSSTATNATAKPQAQADSVWGNIVNELKAGDFFGEKSLINEQPRNATVIAVGPVTCFTLDKKIFLKIVPKDVVERAQDQTLSHSNEEVSSLARHINNYEVLLLMKGRARNATEVKISNALLALMTAFSPELNVNDTIERMMQTLYQVFEAERISLFFVDWETKELMLRVSKDGDLREIRLPITAGLVGSCVASNEIINVKDAKKDPRFFGDFDKKSGFVTRSILCAPIRDGHGVVQGVMQLVNKKGGGFFSQDDEEMLTSVAEQMALTLAHKRIEMQTNVGDRYQPIWKTETPFKVEIKRFLGASLPQTIVSDEIVITMSMYHAGVLLAPDVQYKMKAERTTPLLVVSFQKMLELDIALLDVPRAGRIIFNVSYAAIDEKTNEPLNEPGQPIGWAGATLFNFDQILREGHLRLKLFSGNCDAKLAAVSTILSNSTKKDVDLLEIEFPRFEKPVIYTDYVDPNQSQQQEQKAQSKMMAKMMDEKLKDFIGKDPLYKLKEDDKLLIRASREQLKSNAHALPKFLQATNWNSRQSIQTAYRMLYRWAPPDPMGALNLLDFNFPDPKVRALAVSLLEELSDVELQPYLLQLTQVLKFEPFIDSALARFLLRRALQSPKITGQTFFWLLMAELHVPEARDRYRILLDLFLRHSGEYRTDLGHQMFVLEKLQTIATVIKKKNKAERSEVTRKLIRNIVFPDKFQLPLSPNLYFKGVDVDKCRVMSSKKMPLWLTFQNATPNSEPFTVLYKSGDDLRQDQLTLQVLKVIDQIWKTAGLDLCLSVYGCVSTGLEQGMIEVVKNSSTIAKITAGKKSHFKKIKAVYNVYDLKILKKWLKSKGHPAKIWEQNFLKSCAGYCVATYVLGIGDRHNDNIMLKESGEFFHIDFGHFLGNFKSKLGIKRERAPFVFTPAMAGVLGGSTSSLFKDFEKLCTKAYNELRKHSNLLITLFSLMLSCGIPELEVEDDIGWLRDKLMIGQDDETAGKVFTAKIHESLNTKTQQLNDIAHLIKHV